MEYIVNIIEQYCPEIDIMNEKKIVTNKKIDSIDFVTLVLDLENTFSITIPAEYIKPENFDSIDRIYNMIKRIKENKM